MTLANPVAAGRLFRRCSAGGTERNDHITAARKTEIGIYVYAETEQSVVTVAGCPLVVRLIRDISHRDNIGGVASATAGAGVWPALGTGAAPAVRPSNSPAVCEGVRGIRSKRATWDDPVAVAHGNPAEEKRRSWPNHATRSMPPARG